MLTEWKNGIEAIYLRNVRICLLKREIMKLCKKIPAKNFCQDCVLFLQGCFLLFLPSHASAWKGNPQYRFSCDCLWNPDVGILVHNIGQFCRLSRFSIPYFSSSIAQRQVCNWSKIASLRNSFFFSEFRLSILKCSEM